MVFDKSDLISLYRENDEQRIQPNDYCCVVFGSVASDLT